MNVDKAPQAPSVHEPSGMTTDPIQTLVDVKLSPEGIESTFADDKFEQGTSLAAELRQLEPTGFFPKALFILISPSGFQFQPSSAHDAGTPSDITPDPSAQVAGSNISISQGAPLPPYVARLMEYEKLKQNP